MGRCLLVIDMVNDYVDRLESAERARIVTATNELVTSFRAANLTIIWVRQEFEPDLSDAFPEMRANNIAVTIRGTRGAELDPGLNYWSSDLTIIKKRYSAFFGTNLDALLTALDVREVTLCGVNTHACIRTAAIDAYQRDLAVVIAIDAISSYDPRHAQISLEYMSGRIAKLMPNRDLLTLKMTK